MRLAGDIVVGNAPPDAKFRTTASPSALIHDVPELNPISIFGAHSAGGRPFRNAVLSTAPLGNVRRLSVFRGGPKGFCTGMLLEYADGAQRALGQCRVGVDPVEAHAGPSGICLGLRLYTEAGVAVWLQTTDVRVAGGEECGHEREGAGVGYSCFPMRGDLQFCFSDKETLVQIKN